MHADVAMFDHLGEGDAETKADQVTGAASVQQTARKYLHGDRGPNRKGAHEPDGLLAFGGSVQQTARWRERGLGCISYTGREGKCGIPMVDEQHNGSDKFYNVLWSTQERRPLGAVDMAATRTRRPRVEDPFALGRIAKEIRVTGGTMGLCYADPADKHTPTPLLRSQTSRLQYSKAGKTGLDRDTLLHTQRQHPLKVNHLLVEPRPIKVPVFRPPSTCSRRAPRQRPDLTLFTTAATASIPSSFAATKRSLSRSIRLGPGFTLSRRGKGFAPRFD